MARNSVMAVHMLLDCAPSRLACTESFLRLRRLVSTVPARFDSRVTGARGSEAWQGIVTPETDLCVEGHHGSGNTFVVFSLREALAGSPRVLSHIHMLVQLKRAVAYGVPAVVLVRDPLGACSSLKSKAPAVFDWLLLLRWVQYHAWVWRHRDSLELFLFDEVTHDVDVLRRRCEAVRALCDSPIRPAPRYRNTATQPVALQPRGWPARALLARAERQYRRIERCCEARAADAAAAPGRRPAPGS